MPVDHEVGLDHELDEVAGVQAVGNEVLLDVPCDVAPHDAVPGDAASVASILLKLGASCWVGRLASP